MTKQCDNNVIYLGIRHFGPGCAHALQNVLNELKPEMILLEMPMDSGAALESTQIIEEFPVAILTYAEGQEAETFLFPLDEFSPEWIAIDYAKQHNCEIHCIDLPLGACTVKSELIWHMTESTGNDGLYDSFTHFAESQGFSDTELWWEINFENKKTHSLDLFDEIRELIYAATDLSAHRSEITQFREAWMRDRIRSVRQNCTGTAVVICGAAHLPFIENSNDYLPLKDKKCCEAIKIKKMQISWIPWSEQRLSNMSGYASGMKYPAYYRALWQYGTQASVYMLATIASFFRERGYDISPAHTLEANNLAQALAILRGYPQAGIDEILEAGQAVFNLIDRTKMPGLIKEALVGNKQGKLDLSLQDSPLLVDFEVKMKQLRLNYYRNKAEVIQLKLDLRVPRDLDIDSFLYQLLLLDFKWARPVPIEEGSLGTFKASWILDWHQDEIIGLSRKIVFGHTVNIATRTFYLDCLDKAPVQSQFIASTLDSVLKADLADLIELVTQRISSCLFMSDELIYWTEISISLLHSIQLGSGRSLEKSSLIELLNIILPKLFVNIPLFFTRIDAREADRQVAKIRQLHNSIIRSEEMQWVDAWNTCLHEILQDNNNVSPLHGWVIAELLIQKTLSYEEVVLMFRTVLKRSAHLVDNSYFLKNFIAARRLNEIELPFFLPVLNEWLSSLDHEQFVSILPILRKGFSPNSAWMRSRIKQMISRNNTDDFTMESEVFFHPDLVNAVNELVQKLKYI